MPARTGVLEIPVLFQSLLHHLCPGHHEERLPNSQSDARNDAAKQTADAALLDDVAHHAHHVPGGNSGVPTTLRLDPRDFKRMIPRRQRPTDDPAPDFFPLGQFRALGVAVNRRSRLFANDLCESLSRRPIRRLPERDGDTAWIKSSDPSPRVRRPYPLHRRHAGRVHRARDQVRRRRHDAHLRDPTTRARRHARRSGRPSARE
mmetsp:Transcript_3264/g.12612  ORF Transcript_3264/g.12612 Transcript_3264/m.12612 type:complete len:204 (-) Transcript_3264:265-876(-)